MKKLLLCLILSFAFGSFLHGAAAGLSGIPFSTSQAKFAAGDSITILEVLSSGSNLQPGEVVVVRGEYRLQSQSSALLALNLTSSEPTGPTLTLASSRKQVTAGTGTFELETEVKYNGSLHVTFYENTSTGNSFGGIYFAATQGSTTPTTPPTTTPPTTTPPTPTPPITTSGLTVVPFTTSRNQFASGDSITIQQVLSSSAGMQPGDTVVVRGEYNLQSRATALLMISLTVNAPGATETVAPTARKNIDAGSGTFELAYEIRQPGSLHLSFYPLGVNGPASSFGGIYFAPPQAAGATTNPTNPMSPISSALPILTYPTTNTGRLGNLSIRSVVGAGENTLVAGVTVTDQERYVLIRGVGPTLSKFGVTNFLKKPLISVYKTTGELVASGGAWSSAFTGDRQTGIDLLTASVGGFALTAGSDDAVIHLRLVPGGYTVVISSGDGTSGVALLEVYASPTYSLPVAP